MTENPKDNYFPYEGTKWEPHINSALEWLNFMILANMENNPEFVKLRNWTNWMMNYGYKEGNEVVLDKAKEMGPEFSIEDEDGM